MNYVKGFRFHPTDAESIELLWEKIVLDRDSIVQIGDSPVQVITQLEDICKFEPEELPGMSELDSGDNVWNFFCSPNYKYRNSKRKNRVTNEGYWKPTGKSRQIVTTCDGTKITGIRQTLVFYKGRTRDRNKNKNKNPWVIHEFELTLNLPNQKSLILCKLKKKNQKVDVSRGEGESSRCLPSNLENHYTNNEIPKDQLNTNEPLTEAVEFTEYSGIQSEFATNEQDDEFFCSLINIDDELYSNQHYFVGEKEDPKQQSNSQICFADTDVPKNQEGFGELINQKQKAFNDCVWTKNQVSSSELDNSSWSSILIANDQTYPHGDNNQTNNLFAEEGSSLAFENPVQVDHISKEDSEFDEFFRYGIFMDELSPLPKAPKNSDGIQNLQFSANEQDDAFWNSVFSTTDEVQAYPEVCRSEQRNPNTKNESFNLSSMTTQEALKDPCPMESSTKRPRLELKRLSREDIEAAQVQEKTSFNTEEAQINQTAFE